MWRCSPSSRPRCRKSRKVPTSASPRCRSRTAPRRRSPFISSPKTSAARRKDSGPGISATVPTTIKGTDGQNILVKYKDGEKKVVVPPDTPIVPFVAGDKSELKAGAKIIIFGAVKKDDGVLEANRVNVGRDGITPPPATSPACPGPR